MGHLLRTPLNKAWEPMGRGSFLEAGKFLSWQSINDIGPGVPVLGYRACLGAPGGTVGGTVKLAEARNAIR